MGVSSASEPSKIRCAAGTVNEILTETDEKIVIWQGSKRAEVVTTKNSRTVGMQKEVNQFTEINKFIWIEIAKNVVIS